MRIFIRHETHYSYSSQARSIHQIIKLTPRSHEGQHVYNWRVDFSADARIRKSEDAWGNLTHSIFIESLQDSLKIAVQGELETDDTHGIVRGAIERFPPDIYLRSTDLTAPSPGICDFARDTMLGHASRLDGLHAMMAALNRHIAFDTEPTHVATTAREAFAMRKGVCQDISHIFIAAARHCGIPARYVSGYFRRGDGVHMQEAGHAWAECHVDGIGWIGFDPANGICVTDAHVRIAIGLDYLGAAPIRGTRVGGGQEMLKVELRVADHAPNRQQ
jgi:transglutaminase-like putative cysteine protease